jgi:hypothetical protein
MVVFLLHSAGCSHIDCNLSQKRGNVRRHFVATIAAFVLTLALSTSQFAFSEDQPHMQEALRHLQAAAEELQRATHDKGGHREKALEAIRLAIQHVNEGIQYDNTHHSKDERRDHK